MNREEAKRLLPIIQAYAEGKIVQVMDADKGWLDVFNPLFKPGYLYRIKPDLLECWGVVDRDGDKYFYSSKGVAEDHVSRGSFGPYTIHHMREVEK